MAWTRKLTNVVKKTFRFSIFCSWTTFRTKSRFRERGGSGSGWLLTFFNWKKTKRGFLRRKGDTFFGFSFSSSFVLNKSSVVEKSELNRTPFEFLESTLRTTSLLWNTHKYTRKYTHPHTHENTHARAFLRLAKDTTGLSREWSEAVFRSRR